MFRFIYSSHKSRDAAELALDDYYSTGEVSNGDSPAIVFSRGRWRVMLRG